MSADYAHCVRPGISVVATRDCLVGKAGTPHTLWRWHQRWLTRCGPSTDGKLHVQTKAPAHGANDAVLRCVAGGTTLLLAPSTQHPAPSTPTVPIGR